MTLAVAEDYVEFLTRLGASTDVGLREQAHAELTRVVGRRVCTKTAVADLFKVGPKGYVHDWIFVGVPGLGSRVHHPDLGHGTVSRGGKATAGVNFDSGTYHSFEHGGQGTGHFVQRAGRGGGAKPKKPPTPAKPSPTTPAKPPASSNLASAAAVVRSHLGIEQIPTPVGDLPADIRLSTGRVVSAGGSVVSVHLPSRSAHIDDRVRDAKDPNRWGTVVAIYPGDKTKRTMRVNWDDGSREELPVGQVAVPLREARRHFDLPRPPSPPVASKPKKAIASPKDRYEQAVSDRLLAGHIGSDQAARLIRAHRRAVRT